jgi:tetratricopeptide (TPR) repeat protein
MRAGGESYGVVGALSAFPLRLAARRIESLGGRLHRGVLRGTTHVVFGRKLLGRQDEGEIERRVDAVRSGPARLLSENGFLRVLGNVPAPEMSSLSRQSIIDQSNLDGCTADFLILFDAFEHHCEPFSFRDLILARKYAGLLASGASWSAIARSVHRIGPVGSLTALTLHSAGSDRILTRDAESLSELDGQRLLPLVEAEEDAEDYFGLAETAEAAELFAEAATLYRHCCEIDPSDATAAFNLGNCLRALGDGKAAAIAYATALKRDPEFVEAWFNQAGLLRDSGRVGAARQHLNRAIELDPSFSDAVYNLGALEYDAGDLAMARHWWSRYLELDPSSEWARRARAGIALADQFFRKSAG